MMTKKRLGLFEGYGIELEYMIVDLDTLAPLFICDQVLEGIAGHKTMSIDQGLISWSNELALHVIELKCNGPQKDLVQVESAMVDAVKAMNRVLKGYHAQLLPSAMHPFFDPADGSLKLWSSEDSEIYSAYNRIFNCQGHGWGNLQSIHINLPFANDDEFYRLHTAIRLVLPLLPALAASSPYIEGKRGPWLDSRLSFYLKNQRKIPQIIGDAIPEPIRNQSEYQEKILEPMYRAIAAMDPDGLLQHEWLNSRAAIARFDRHAIEIRILDIQECLAADFTIIQAVIHTIKMLCQRDDTDQQASISQASLKAILMGALHEQADYVIEDANYRQFFAEAATIGDACRTWLPSDLDIKGRHWQQLSQGQSLAKRLIEGCGSLPDRNSLIKEYQDLAKCLVENRIYQP